MCSTTSRVVLCLSSAGGGCGLASFSCTTCLSWADCSLPALYPLISWHNFLRHTNRGRPFSPPACHMPMKRACIPCDKTVAVSNVFYVRIKAFLKHGTPPARHPGSRSFVRSFRVFPAQSHGSVAWCLMPRAVRSWHAGSGGARGGGGCVLVLLRASHVILPQFPARSGMS